MPSIVFGVVVGLVVGFWLVWTMGLIEGLIGAFCTGIVAFFIFGVLQLIIFELTHTCVRSHPDTCHMPAQYITVGAPPYQTTIIQPAYDYACDVCDEYVED